MFASTYFNQQIADTSSHGLHPHSSYACLRGDINTSLLQKEGMSQSRARASLRVCWHERAEMIGQTLFPLCLFRAQKQSKESISCPSEQQYGRSTREEMSHQKPEYQRTRQHQANGQSAKQLHVSVNQINEQANHAYCSSQNAHTISTSSCTYAPPMRTDLP